MTLDVGIAAEEVCFRFGYAKRIRGLVHSDRRLAPLDGSCPHYEMPVSCRRFRLLLEEFGVPFYVKVDIQSNDFFCVEDLDPYQLPRPSCVL